MRRSLAKLLLLLVSAATLVQETFADGEVTVLTRLKEVYPEWSPNAALDVGANVGAWTVRARRMYPDTKILMLEAYNDFAERLQQKKDQAPNVTDFQIAVLSARDGETVDFYQKGNTGNSMFKQIGAKSAYENVEPVQKVTSTLDTVKKNSFLKDERVDYIKLDVQGKENKHKRVVA